MPPSNTVINLDTSNAPAELTLWPDFHSGVAAGLRVAPAFEASTSNAYDTELSTAINDNNGGAKLVTRNWILYNRPVASNYQDMEEVEAARLMDQDSAGYAGTMSARSARLVPHTAWDSSGSRSANHHLPTSQEKTM